MKTVLLSLLLLPLPALCQVLLPGDANNDGRVNHVDLLAIGLNFGQAGPPRIPPAQGIDWTPKPFLFWPTTLPTTGINDGFSDCDGDGIVSPEDIRAIKFNYDSAHNLSQPPPQPYQPFVKVPTTARPKLVFVFDKDTATVNDTLRLNIFYEQPPGLPQAISPMGVAFTLEFKEEFIKDSLTNVRFEPSANDLHFAAGANGFADARKLPPGRVEFSTSGERAPRLSSSRPLGVVDFVIEEVIVRGDTFWTNFKADVAKVLFLDTLERFYDYDLDIDEVVLFQPVDSFALCPGDANNDGMVNAFDVLPIGLNFKKEGNPRKAKHQGMSWGPKPFEPWLEEMPSTGINLAFSDSDGDGAITEKDILAIQFNYDSTHYLAFPPSQPWAPPPSGIPADAPPMLIFHFKETEAYPGDTLHLVASYVPPQGLPDEYFPRGVAFALEFDESLVQDSLTKIIFPEDDNLLAAGGATRFALAREVPPGLVEAGVANKGVPALGQPRDLCTIRFVLENALPAGHAGLFAPAMAKLLMINGREQDMPVIFQIEEMKILVSSSERPNPLPVHCYPSPVRENLWVESPEAPLAHISVFDAFGRLIADQNIPEQTLAEIPVRHWQSGMYWIETTASDGRTALKKIVKF